MTGNQKNDVTEGDLRQEMAFMQQESYNRIKIFDEIKAVSIIAVVLFHLRYFKYGYLGVDLFIVVAGYLTMQSVSRSIEKGTYGFVSFIVKRVRRLLPLVLLASASCLAIGYIVMLPDDYENLAQSVIASAFFANNILCRISSGDYWAINNDFKPLLHFWYLGVLMQLYCGFLLIVSVCKCNAKRIYSVTMILGVVSLAMMFMGIGEQPLRFYYMPWRFYEFAIGVLLFAIFPHLPNKIHCSIPFVDIIGRATLSVYVWHYVILAFYRYIAGPNLSFLFISCYVIVLALISYWSYLFFEKGGYSRKSFFMVLLCFILINVAAFHILQASGVMRDVTELDIKKDSAVKGMHNKYNERIRMMGALFPSNSKINVLVIGNSFARDWVNVLLESKWADMINIAYSSQDANGVDLTRFLKKADVIFLAGVYIDRLPSQLRNAQGQIEIKGDLNVWVVGDKWLGVSNGMIYSRRFFNGYYDQQLTIPREMHNKLAQERVAYHGKYIDIMGLLSPDGIHIPVFTDDKKFISQDCKHFTQGGARYVARGIDLQACFGSLKSDGRMN